MKIRSFAVLTLAALALSACSFAGYSITREVTPTPTSIPTVTSTPTVEEEAYLECTRFVAKQYGLAMQQAVPYQSSDVVIVDSVHFIVNLNYTTGAFYTCRVFEDGDYWILQELK